MWNTNPSTVIPTATAAIGSRTSAVALAPLTGPVQVSNSPTTQRHFTSNAGRMDNAVDHPRHCAGTEQYLTRFFSEMGMHELTWLIRQPKSKDSGTEK
jgi:hypothetical protein